jgi:type IV fimbrial biogenesis protein FimT
MPGCHHRFAGRPSRGFTMVELMVGLALAAILAFLAVPAFSHMFARVRVQGVANELSTDIQYARSESVRRRAAVTLAADLDGGGYSITSGAEAVKAVRFSGDLVVTNGVIVKFDQLRSTANEAELTVSSGIYALRVQSNPMGRVALCSPGGTIKGYVKC